MDTKKHECRSVSGCLHLAFVGVVLFVLLCAGWCQAHARSAWGWMLRCPLALAFIRVSSCLFVVLFFLSGCAGSRADTNFRSRVESVELYGSGDYHSGTVELGGRIYYRLPEKKGLAK